MWLNRLKIQIFYVNLRVDCYKRYHNMDKLTQLASRFALEGAIAQVKPLGEGFINDTYNGAVVPIF